MAPHNTQNRATNSRLWSKSTKEKVPDSKQRPVANKQYAALTFSPMTRTMLSYRGYDVGLTDTFY